MHYYNKENLIESLKNQAPPELDIAEKMKSDQLYHDPILSEQFETVIGNLKAVFYDKLKTSKTGDNTLESAADHPDEARLFNELEQLYDRKDFIDSKEARGHTQQWQDDLLEATRAIKPAYDTWKLNKAKREQHLHN